MTKTIIVPVEQPSAVPGDTLTGEYHADVNRLLGVNQQLREELTMFVHLAESRLRELGDLSPEMAECLNKGRDALTAIAAHQQQENHHESLPR